MDTKQAKPSTTNTPPVVAVLGHVDHGKTTLLDAIRKSSIAEREFGGITQRIGASSVEITHEGKKRRITFIDTPGHEAFTKMRSRGAQVADIGLLIVSAVDGVMPQTKESISLLLAAKIPFIVVLTKADLPTKISEKVKQQLASEHVLVEGLGGDIPVIEVSAKTNLNIHELLDLILLVYDLKKDAGEIAVFHPADPVRAIVIESRLDPKAGPKATVIVKSGTIKVRNALQTDNQVFKVRSLLTDRGQMVLSATVGDAIEILGFTEVPPVGSIVTEKVDIGEEKTLMTPLKRELVYQKPKEEEGLLIVLVGDTQGSLEAITSALPPQVKVVSQKTGEITEADVLYAKSTGSIVLGFNTPVKPPVAKLAQTEKVLAKNYKIIYEMLTEIADVLEGKRIAGLEQIFGTAKILATFPFEKTTVFGVKITDGRLAKGDKVRVERNGEVIGESTIASLRSGKTPVSKLEEGNEAGVLLAPLLDFRVGDMLLSHS